MKIEISYIVLPNEGPKIHGSKSKYEVGDDVSLNCTSSKSKPASILRWSINDKSVMKNIICVYFIKFQFHFRLIQAMKFNIQLHII